MVFGQSVFDYQSSRFVLAECATAARVARVFLDWCVQQHLAGTLDAFTAGQAKLWLAEQQCDVIDRRLQLFGGYAYIRGTRSPA